MSKSKQAERHIRKFQLEKKELDDMFARREGVDVSIIRRPSNHGSCGASPSILKKAVHFESPEGSNKRRLTTSFLASMNFQDNHKRQKTMPKKPEEGRITWSNVYDAPPIQVPKVKVDDSRGNLLIMMGRETEPETPSNDSENHNAWKELVEAMPSNDTPACGGRDKASNCVAYEKNQGMLESYDPSLRVDVEADVAATFQQQSFANAQVRSPQSLDFNLQTYSQE